MANKYIDMRPPKGLPLFAVPKFDPTLSMPKPATPSFEYTEPMSFAEPGNYAETPAKAETAGSQKDWKRDAVLGGLGAAGGALEALAMGGGGGSDFAAAALPGAVQGDAGAAGPVMAPFTGGRPNLSQQQRESLALAMLARGGA